MSIAVSDSNYQEVLVTQEDRENFKRLDQFLAAKISDLSRSVIKSLFQNDRIYLSQESTKSINKTKLELKRMPCAGSIVCVEVPPPLPSVAQAEDIPLKIIFEDEHLIIVNKEAGMVTHPAPGNYTGTLVNAILFHCSDLKGVGDQKRPGIVHRLDKGTSGIMAVAKTSQCHEGLIKLFSTHRINRQYMALTMGQEFEPKGKIETLIGRHPQNRLKMSTHARQGKKAITHYKVEKYLPPCTLLELTLETGRTHQIRVHLSEILKSPILMDPTYASPKEHLHRLPPEVKRLIQNYEYPFLHAKKLGLIHPITQEKLLFEEDPPNIFQRLIKALQG